MEVKELHTDLMTEHGLYIVKHKHYNGFYEYVGDRVNICVLCIDEKYNKPHLFPLDVTRDDDKDSRHQFSNGSAKQLSTEDGVLADIIIADCEVINFYYGREKDIHMYLSCFVSDLKYRNGEIYNGNIEYVAIVEEGYGDRFVPELVEEDKEND